MSEQRTFSLKVIRAAVKTVNAYRELIADPAQIKKWGGYGLTSDCRLCKAVGRVAIGGTPRCDKCPLSKGDDFIDNNRPLPCARRYTGFSDLEGIIANGIDDPVYIKEIASARLDWIIERLADNGIDFTDEQLKE